MCESRRLRFQRLGEAGIATDYDRSETPTHPLPNFRTDANWLAAIVRQTGLRVVRKTIHFAFTDCRGKARGRNSNRGGMQVDDQPLARCVYEKPDFRRDVTIPNVSQCLVFGLCWLGLFGFLYKITPDKSGRFGRFSLPSNVSQQTWLNQQRLLLLAAAVVALIVCAAIVIPFCRSRIQAFRRHQISFLVFTDRLEVEDNTGATIQTLLKPQISRVAAHEEMGYWQGSQSRGLIVFEISSGGSIVEFDSSILYGSELARFFGADNLKELSGKLTS